MNGRGGRLVDRLSARVHPTLFGPLGSILVSARRRELCLVRASEDGWIHRYREGIAVHASLDGPSARVQDQAARDHFLYRYSPRRGDVVFDVGAGVGGEVRLFSRLVGATGRVVSIEARPRTFRLLTRTVALNRLANVTALQAALTGARETVYIDHDTGAGSAVTRVAGAGVAVAGLTLPDVMELVRVDRIDLLKMNIEGSELPALRAATSALASVRNIVVSCHDFKADRGGGDWQRTYQPVTDLLYEAGFTVRSRPTDTRPSIRYYAYGAR
jgi:FkbM family methyltransferase